MKILRIFKYFLHKLLIRRRAASFSFEVDKKPNKFIYYLGVISGFIYHYFQKLGEITRIHKYKIKKRNQEHKIGWDIIKLSKSLIVGIFVFVILSTLLDYGINLIPDNLLSFFNKFYVLHWLDIGFIELVLEISIGAISAILGLIFALYAVGFGITTEKYSSEISDYVNQELVGSFFFKLLIFTDLSALFILLRTKFIDINPFFSFPAVIVLVTISLLGILIFKNHYIVSIKPKSLFGRMWGDIKENIDLSSDRSKAIFGSWSVIQHVRNKSQDILNLIETLFEDLCRAQNWHDAKYAPIILSNILTEYVSRKRYIDKGRGWWFPQKYHQIKSDNLTALPIKLNYELQGKGPLHITKPDFDWFEDRALRILQKIESKIEDPKGKDILMPYIINAYQTILAGDYKKDKHGRYQKDIIGFYENQEIDTFDKFFRNLLNLFSKIDLQNDNHITEYINAYFAVGLVLVEGFNREKYQKEIQKLITPDQKLAVTKKYIEEINLPTIFYNQLLDYWNRLELEQRCEDKILTLAGLLEKEMLLEIESKEKEIFKKYFDLLIEHQDLIIDKLYKEGQYKILAEFLKIRLEWISRLLYVHKSNIAEKYAQKLIKNKAVYLLVIPKEILLDLEFLEQIEKLIFPSIIERRQSLSKELVHLLLLLFLVINKNETDLDKLVYRNRLIVILGGFIYFTSEFYQDRQILFDYIELLEKTYGPERLIQMLEMISEPKKLGGLSLTLKLIPLESTRYHYWFMHILHKILDLPKVYDHVRFYGGMQEVADHTSKFIREMSHTHGVINHEEDCIKAFVEWVKKREEVKKFIHILNLIKDEKENK